jgi:HlyD family secretion protein
MSATAFHNKDDIEHSVESLERIHGRDIPYIYWMFLLLILGAVASLPLIKVDISVGGQGQVRPALERIPILPAVDGYIKDIHVVDNQAVLKNDTLLEISSPVLDARIAQNLRQSEENAHTLEDLALLLSAPTTDAIEFSYEGAAVSPGQSGALPTSSIDIIAKHLITGAYIRQFALFVSDLEKNTLQRAQLQREVARSKGLHDRGLVTDQSFEQQQYDCAIVEREIHFLIAQMLSQWQADKLDRELKQIDLESEGRQLSNQKDLYTLRAPVSGTALGFIGLNTAVYIPVGQRLGDISSDDLLQADVYLNPRDIGFVHPTQQVTIQVDAFPYTEWGTIKGHVRTVSQDSVQLGQLAAFKVVIDLDKTLLHSSTDITAVVRRGMSINARFIVRRQTLFHILFGRLSDFLDPTATPTGKDTMPN